MESRSVAFGICGAGVQPTLSSKKDAGWMPAPQWSLHQRTQDLAPLRQLLVGGGVADAEVRVALGEDVAGDDQDVVVDGLRDEFAGRHPAGRLGKDVERAARPGDFELLRQPLE